MKLVMMTVAVLFSVNAFATGGDVFGGMPSTLPNDIETKEDIQSAKRQAAMKWVSENYGAEFSGTLYAKNQFDFQFNTYRVRSAETGCKVVVHVPNKSEISATSSVYDCN